MSLLSKLISSVNSTLSCGYLALDFGVVGLSFMVYLYNTEEVHVIFSLHDTSGIFFSISVYSSVIYQVFILLCDVLLCVFLGLDSCDFLLHSFTKIGVQKIVIKVVRC